MMVFLGLVWIAFLVGLVIGWAWKPKWVTVRGDKLTFHVSKFLDLSLPSSPLKGFASASCSNSFMISSKKDEPCHVDNPADKKSTSLSISEYENCSPSQQNEEQSNVANLVTEKDLEHLCQLIEMKDGGPTWIQMMDCSTPGMRCQAWRREPKTGPPQYQTRTVFENATPEMVRDFFWDDEFRATWDDMLAYSATIDECLTTGTMIVQWIRKFPLFCSDREYIIGRRIWELGGSYYCVTKGVPCSSVPRRAKPRRVDLYYSSWCIRAVESRMGDGRLIACEVLLFHHEEMGIPWEIAKLGVKHGMWGTVKKFEPGLRAYQKARASGVPLSRPAFMAQITTKINSGLPRSLAVNENSSETEVAAAATSSNRSLGRKIPKWLIFGGVFVLACSIDRGLLTKAFIFGVARKFANIGKRL
ncbi:hypothetical protein P3X46_017377 [Hevea brasiliensis]|uniref:START domain-containing protein n=1 Tax=Hevea brasiliensis TaxID=3981 RepID=A0ABQ9M231_HEVBR|nr:uncharacterized protein LOC110656826 [Hevea brasiliensis]KAJ9174346.1 hypothetical protein P3X46_017377 [Hevea brasiliensis]